MFTFSIECFLQLSLEAVAWELEGKRAATIHNINQMLQRDLLRRFQHITTKSS